MTLADVRDFLKSKIQCDNWYAGKRDPTKEQSITIFPTQGPAPIIPVGGLERKSWETKAVSVLVHWGKYATPAEEKAQEVYNLLFGQTAAIRGKRVAFFDMRTSEPVGMGTDDGGIFEYVINFVIYYNK